MQIIDVTDPKQLDEFYRGSALTFIGVYKHDAKSIFEWIKNFSKMNDEIDYIVSGKMMNDYYRLTGSNRYKDDLTIHIIPLETIENVSAIIVPRFSVGARWFDDIVDNNLRREEEM